MLLCIVDTNLVIDAFRYTPPKRNTSTEIQQKQRTPAYHIIDAFKKGNFDWIYSDDIKDEYIYQFNYLKKKASQSKDKRPFDSDGFYQLLKLLNVKVTPLDKQEQEAYQTIMDPSRAEHLRDEDDAIFLAAADAAAELIAAEIVLIGSEDSDLYTLKQYKGIPILTLDPLLQRIYQT